MTVLLECPCCFQKTLTERHVWEICGICNWEDDQVAEADPDYTGGANGIYSLKMAQKNYAQYGSMYSKDDLNNLSKTSGFNALGKGD